MVLMAFVSGCSLFERRPSELPPPDETAVIKPTPARALEPSVSVMISPAPTPPSSLIITPVQSAENSASPEPMAGALPEKSVPAEAVVPKTEVTSPVVAAVKASATAASGNFEYVVQNGDTLFSIARRFYGSGFNANALYLANGLKPGDKVAEGQVLKLVNPKDSEPTPHAKGSLRPSGGN